MLNVFWQIKVIVCEASRRLHDVLIVDDDAMVAELNRRYVAQISGFHCCGTASTLEKAKEFIFNSENHIDLILLDIYMQQENGLICCLSCTAQAAKRRYCHFFCR